MYSALMNTHGHFGSSDFLEQREAHHLGTGKIDFGTLVLDRHGRILSSGDAVAQMLGQSANRLHGRDVADFVGGLCLGGSSARYRSGYLDYLAAYPEWRELDVRASEGNGSDICFKLSAIVTEGRRLFLLTMRRMGKDNLHVSTQTWEAAEL